MTSIKGVEHCSGWTSSGAMLTPSFQAYELLWDIAGVPCDAYRRQELVLGVVERSHHGDDLPTKVKFDL